MADSNAPFEGMDTLLLNLAKLIGLIDEGGAFNKDWFKDPKTDVKQSFTWPHLKAVLEADALWGPSTHPLTTAFLEQPKKPDSVLEEISNESWYSLKGKDADSPFFFVAKEVGNTAFLGAGICKKIDKPVFDIFPFLFVPIFQMPNGEDAPAGFELHTDGPVELGVMVELKDNRTAGGYSGFLLKVSIDLKEGSPAHPKFTLYKKQDGNWYKVTVDIESMIPNIINPFLALGEIFEWLEGLIALGLKASWSALLEAIKFIKRITPFAPPYFTIPDLKLNIGDWKVWIGNLFYNAFLSLKPEDGTVTLLKGPTSDDPDWKIDLILKENRLGLGITVKNIEVAKEPRVGLQIGKLTGDETDWLEKTQSDPFEHQGMVFWLLTVPDNLSITFEPHFVAQSVGLDIDRKTNQPLFDIDDYTVLGAQLRGYFSTLEKVDGKFAWGIAAAMRNISLPLGAPGGGNPVASTLLESSDKDKPSVNPEFSFLAAYSKTFYFQLFDKIGIPQDSVEIPIQKSFGPVKVESIAIGYKDNNADPQLLFGLSGGLDLSILELYLDKLTVGIPILDPSNLSSYSLDLEGIGVNMKTSGIALSGGLFKTINDGNIEYSGAVALQAAKWSIGAMGAFSIVDDQPSMFIFGTLNAVLGGPAFFVVKGVAAGFGYNRNLILPKLGQVKNYPLVKGALNPGYFTEEDPGKALQQMAAFVPPLLGEYWLAAGVKFSSFELIDSFALLAVKLGKKSEISLIGTSTMKMPKEGAPFVHVEIDLLAVFTPDDGTLQVNGKLSSNSWVLDKECKLRGEFAFYNWFSGDHEGDFVLSIGGYHPDYQVPDHYPAVERLSMNWQVDSKTRIAGEAYFALTPSVVMGGCKLELNYQNGNLAAWFTAWADFIISWKPFHYDVEIGMTVGASYRVKVLFIHKTFRVELGAKVRIWGPKFSGEAKISWWVISFTIPFGAKAAKATDSIISWDVFKATFLPADQDGKQSLLKINVNDGLKEIVEKDGLTYWVIDPECFDFNVASSIPVTNINFGDIPAYQIACAPFNIFPMGNGAHVSNNASRLDVKLSPLEHQDTPNEWSIDSSPQNVPYALWGLNNGKQSQDDDSLVEGITMGLSSIRIPHSSLLSGPASFDISKLDFSLLDYKQKVWLQFGPIITESKLSYANALSIVSDTIMEENVKEKRTEIFEFLQDIGSNANQDGDLGALEAQTSKIFQGSPMLSREVKDDISFVVEEVTFTSAPSSKFTSRYTGSPQSIFQVNYDGELETIQPYSAVDLTARRGHSLAASIDQFLNSYYGRSSTGKTHFGGRLGRKSGIQFLLKNSAEAILNTSTIRNSMVLQAGTTQMWNLKSTEGLGTQLKLEGNLKLRIIAWDKHSQIVLHDIVSKHEGLNTVIPPEARQLLLLSLDKNQNYNGIYGWHVHSTLIQASSQWLVGRGALVQGQAPHQISVGSRTRKMGSTTGSALVKSNFYSGADGDQIPAMISTHFQYQLTEVFVLLRAEAGIAIPANAAKVTFSLKDANGNTQFVSGVTVIREKINGDTFLSAMVPQQWNRLGGLCVQVQVQKDFTLRGVLGVSYNNLNLTDPSIIDLISENYLMPEAYRRADGAKVTSTVTFDYSPKKALSHGK